MSLRDFIPPFATKAARRILGRSGSKQYANYAEAQADCTRRGYEDHHAGQGRRGCGDQVEATNRRRVKDCLRLA